MLPRVLLRLANDRKHRERERDPSTNAHRPSTDAPPAPRSYVRGVEIRAGSGPDRPGPAALGAAIAAGLAVGLALTRVVAGSTPPPVTDGAAMSATPGAEPASEPAAEPEPPAVVSEAEAGAVEPEDAPAILVPATTPSSAESAPVARATPPAAPAPVTEWTRIVRGRVAYLRCEGIPAAPGPEASDGVSGCPRDAALEQAVWRAIEGLSECDAAPTSAGEADLVVDLALGSPVEVRTRNRFAPDVVRVDGDAVTSCLTPALSTATSALGASRLVVSFRFRAVP